MNKEQPWFRFRSQRSFLRFSLSWPAYTVGKSSAEVNAMSEQSYPSEHTVPVWDILIRIFHWS
ncbi:MAG: hypothetical protein R3309_06730, partial [Reinekea sp.]|nr:hypothetical protein [Reinekea sp.]